MAFQESKCLAETLNRLPYIITHHSLPLCWLRFLLHVLDLNTHTRAHSLAHTHEHKHSRSRTTVRQAPSNILMPAPFVCSSLTLSLSLSRHTHTHWLSHTFSLSPTVSCLFSSTENPVSSVEVKGRRSFGSKWADWKGWKRESRHRSSKKSHQQLRLYLPEERRQRLQRRQRRQRRQQPEKRRKLTINLMDGISFENVPFSRSNCLDAGVLPIQRDYWLSHFKLKEIRPTLCSIKVLMQLFVTIKVTRAEILDLFKNTQLSSEWLIFFFYNEPLLLVGYLLPKTKTGWNESFLESLYSVPLTSNLSQLRETVKPTFQVLANSRKLFFLTNFKLFNCFILTFWSNQAALCLSGCTGTGRFSLIPFYLGEKSTIEKIWKWSWVQIIALNTRPWPLRLFHLYLNLSSDYFCQMREYLILCGAYLFSYQWHLMVKRSY